MLAITTASVQAETAQLPEGPAKLTLQRVCGGCHPAQIVLGRKASRDQWEQVVVDMIQKGTNGTDEEFNQIIDYLATHFPDTPAPAPKIHINKASASELVAVLDILGEQAAAIVQHRTGKGNFKSVDDLKKVPGLDASKVDAKKDLLVF